HHQYSHLRPIRSTPIHPLRRLLEIRRLRVRNIQKLLRVAIHQRKPRTLDLNHDAMAWPERMQHIRHPILDLLLLARCERLRLRETVAELTAERLAPHKLLISSQVYASRVRSEEHTSELQSRG